ncbi:MAG: hypothetical protein HUJ66_00785 [Oscillospiraceae bacterium]|nr:hypothetical protein [Oscillospiraceae bacterium]
MKRTYTKPQIAFDSFELSQSIASCSVITNAVVAQCAYSDPESGFNIFVESIAACSEFPQPGLPSDSSFGGVCYEIPEGNLNLFSS